MSGCLLHTVLLVVSDQSHVPSTSFVAISSSTLHEGKWTQDKHEAFLTGRTKYGNKWTKIATTIPTQTVMQIKKHAQIYDQKKNECCSGLAILKISHSQKESLYCKE
jgi:hypothetical protein